MNRIFTLLSLLLAKVLIGSDAFIVLSNHVVQSRFNQNLDMFRNRSRIHKDDNKDLGGTSKSNANIISSNASGLSSNYYLLTASVWKFVICNTILLVILEKLLRHYKVIPFSSTFMASIICHCRLLDLGIMEGYVLPLLASSCCAIQLLINIFTGIGCVGFNSYLGPFRKFFVTILLYSTVSNFSKIKFIISWCAALMPEFLHLINNMPKHRQQIIKESMNKTDSFQRNVNIKVLDMGCVACINKIESTLVRDFPATIIGVKAILNDIEKGGEVQVKVISNENEFQSIICGIRCSIEKAGFKCQQF